MTGLHLLKKTMRAAAASSSPVVARAVAGLVDSPLLPAAARRLAPVHYKFAQTRARLIRLGVRTLRAMAQSRSTYLPRLLNGLIEHAPTTPATKERLFEAVIAGTPAERAIQRTPRHWARAGELRLEQMATSDRTSATISYRARGTSGGLPISWQILKDSVGRTEPFDLLASSMERLQAFETLHLFVEQDVNLGTVLLNPRLAGKRFVVYSFRDRQADIEALGLGDRAVSASLRDRFPDMSPEGESAQLFAKHLAEQAVRETFGTGISAAAREAFGQSEVFAQGLEDDVAWRLALAECFRWGAREVPETEAIVFACTRTVYFPHILPLVEREVADERIFLAFGGSVRSNEKSFWCQVAGYTQDCVGRDDRAVLRDRDSEAAFDAWLTAKAQYAKSIGESAARRLTSSYRPADDPPLLLVVAPSAKPYVETAGLLLHDLVTRRHRTCIAVSCASTMDDLELPAVAELAGSERLILGDTSFLLPILADGLPKQGPVADFLTCLVERLSGAMIYQGLSLRPLVEPLIREWLGSKTFSVFAMRAFGRTLCSSTGARAMLVMPSRHWLVRAVAATVQSEQQAAVVDVQVLNVVRHPKYRPPIGDLGTVIDTTSEDLYREFLCFPGERIRLTGTPCNDSLRQQITAIDRAEMAKSVGLAPVGRRRVLLASQLQPFHRMGKIAEAICDLAADLDGMEVMIKLHPREGDGRAQAYQAIIAERRLGDRVVLVRDLTPAEAIAACDVVVTIYSNLAREAAIAGKEVILALLFDWMPPIRLDLEGLAIGATSEEEFREALKSALTRSEQAGATAAGSQYFSRNPHLKSGRSTDRIAEVVGEAECLQATRQTGDRQRLESPDFPATDDNAEQRTELPQHEIVVIAQDAADLWSIRDVVPPRSVLRVYSPQVPPSLADLGHTVRFETGDYNLDTKDWVHSAVDRANLLADRLCELIEAMFAGSLIGDRLAALRYPMWIRLRPSLIAAARIEANYRRGLASADAALVVLGRDEQFIHDCLSLIDEDSLQSLRTVLVNPEAFQATNSSIFGLGALSAVPGREELKRALALLRAAPPGQRFGMLGSILKSHLPEMAGGGLPEKDAAAVAPIAPDSFDGWLEILGKTPPPLPRGPRIVLTTAWHLKTVPPTMTPILQSLPPEIGILAFTMTAEGHAELHAQVTAARPLSDQAIAIAPQHLEANLPPVDRKRVKTAKSALLAKIAADHTFAGETAILRNAVSAAADNMLRVGLWQLLAWSEWCRHAFADGQGVSVACPGRQWHSEVAHISAAAAGARSITVQNAYMTSGYTYTKPTGDVITAIDTWSRDVLVGKFGVDPEKVLVSSTPRFDYLAKLQAESSESARLALGFAPTGPVVCFAAQPGLDDATRILVRAFAATEGAGPIRFCIKLHPRSPDRLLQELDQLIAQLVTSHSFRITRDEPIQPLLAAADIVATIFSNVGIEAAAMGKSLLIAHLEDGELPLPLDRFGIGFVAHTPEEVQTGLVRFLTDAAFAAEMRQSQRAYFTDNPAVREGGSTRIITDVILQGLTAI